MSPVSQRPVFGTEARSASVPFQIVPFQNSERRYRMTSTKSIEKLSTRRTALLSAAAFLVLGRANAAEEQVVTVYKDLRCGCCSTWMQHLQSNGFVTKAMNMINVDAAKAQFGVPADLATCHTAQIGGYVIEGHVPVAAIKRLLAEKPNAAGLAVPGMPAGSPGMEGGQPERYDAILFGPNGRRAFMRFRGDQES